MGKRYKKNMGFSPRGNVSYTRIWIHTVFVTKNRNSFLTKEIKPKIISHIKENAKKKGIFVDTINGDKEHLHCLISLSAEQSIAKVLQLIKGEVSSWINKSNQTKTKFGWADEYFAVSVSESQINAVRNYIKTQEEHHRIKSFSEEYYEFMKKYGFTNLG